MKSGKREIPGFYYDYQKDRYFRLLPGQSPPVDSSPTQSDTRKIEKLLILEKNEKKKRGSLSSIFDLVCNRALGKYSPLEFQRKHRFLSIADNAWPNFEKPTCLLGRSSPYPHNLDCDIQVIAPKPRQDGIAVLSKIADQERSLFQLYKVTANAADEVAFTHVYPDFVLERISSVCWNPHADMKNTVLLSTLLFDGGTLLLYSFENFQDNLEDSPLAFRHERYRTRMGCIWTAKWNPNPSYKNMIGIGTYNGFTLRTIGSWRNEKVVRVGSDVFSLDFGTQNPTLFCGARDGKLRMFDLRSINAGPRHESDNVMCIGKSLDWIKLTQDEQRVFLSTLDGKVELWDIGMRKCIGYYMGHCNSHSHLSQGLFENEEYLYAVGEDSTCRVWHVPDKVLVKSIVYPYEINDKVVRPSIVYGDHWAQREGLSGFLYGVKKSIFFHPL